MQKRIGADTAEVVVTSNVTTKFREAFETYTAGDKWNQVLGDGDIVQVDGNCAASSYLVISKDPLTAGNVTTIETVNDFAMPFEASIGLSLSQRTLGQEFSVEFVDTDTPLTPPADLTISSVQQAATTLTITTATPHGLAVGARFGVFGVSDSRLNYPALVVATTPSATQFTATVGPGGAIPSVTAGPFNSGFVYFRSALGFSKNGTSLLFENGVVTNASAYIRSESGDVLPSGNISGNHSVAVGTTASVQAVNAALNYSFQPTTEYRLSLMADRLQWSDSGVDSTSGTTARVTRSQVVPSPNKRYKLRFRATDNKALTVPTAQIVSVAKSGSATATIIFDRPHNLTTADVFVAYGVRDQTNFANLTTATAIASVVNATTITAIWGASVTATSYGGYAAKVQGGNLMSALGAIAQSAQSITQTSNIITLVGSAAWSGLLIGDYVNLVGIRDISTGATLGVDGAYRVRDIQTTNLFLEPIGTTAGGSDIVTTNCGGAVIKRTDMRISFARVFDYERERVELLPRASGDVTGSVPVTVNGTPAVTVSSGTVTTVTTLSNGQAAHDAVIAGSPHRIAGRAVTANYTAVATGDTADLITTTVGATIVKPYAIPEASWNASLALTTTTAAAIQTAAGAGLKRHVTALQAINTGASAVDLIILDGVTERWRLPLPVNVPVSIPFPTEIVNTANTALNANLSAAGTVRANFQGYTAP